MFGDSGYLGIQKRDEHRDRQNVSWSIAKRPGSRKKLDDRKLKAENLKAGAWAKVEHPFRYVKQVFGYNKVRYRGLAKNSNRLHLLAAFSNLLMGEKYAVRVGPVRLFSAKTQGNGQKNKQTEGLIVPNLPLNGFFRVEKRFSEK